MRRARCHRLMNAWLLQVLFHSCMRPSRLVSALLSCKLLTAAQSADATVLSGDPADLPAVWQRVAQDRRMGRQAARETGQVSAGAHAAVTCASHAMVCLLIAAGSTTCWGGKCRGHPGGWEALPAVRLILHSLPGRAMFSPMYCVLRNNPACVGSALRPIPKCGSAPQLLSATLQGTQGRCSTVRTSTGHLVSLGPAAARPRSPCMHVTPTGAAFGTGSRHSSSRQC